MAGLEKLPEWQQMALLAPSRQPIKRQNLHPSTTFDCGLPDRQRARADAVEAISSVAVCTALCLHIDRFPYTFENCLH